MKILSWEFNRLGQLLRMRLQPLENISKSRYRSEKKSVFQLLSLNLQPKNGFKSDLSDNLRYGLIARPVTSCHLALGM